MIDALASGKLVKDPVTRESKSGSTFVTCLLRCDTGEEAPVLVSVIAFREAAEKLARLRAGDGVSIAGSAKLSAWTKDGETRHGLSVTASCVLSAYDVRKRRGADEQAKPAHRPASEPEFNDDIRF